MQAGWANRFRPQRRWTADRRHGSRWGRWWPFVLLLLVGGSRWMLADAHPETGSTLASEALGCAWAALLCIAWPHESARAMRRFAFEWRDVLAGALLLAGPASALLIGGSELDGANLTIALALTPVAVAIAAAALGMAHAEGVAGRIWPGLAAVAGLLLVLTEPSLADGRSDAAMLLAPALTGVGAVLLRADDSAEQRPSTASSALRWRAAAALAGGALLFALTMAVRWLTGPGRPEITLAAVACDGLIALLGVLALLRLGATRWSAQFALLPLLVLLEGILLVHPALTARTVLALGLLALGSVYLLLPPADELEAGPAVVPR